MISKTHVLHAAALMALVPSSSALADVIARDVWNNMRAYSDAFGGSLEADVQETDDGLSLTEMTYHFSMTAPYKTVDGAPSELVIGQISLPDQKLVNYADGTVLITLPPSSTIAATIQLPKKEEAINLSFQMVSQGLNQIASGEPGTITYTYSADSMSYSGDMVIPKAFNKQAPADSSVSMSVETENLNGRVTITEGALLGILSSFETERMTLRMKAQTMAENGQLHVQSQTVLNQEIKGDVAIPTGGVSLLNLAEALDRGLRLEVRSKAGATTQSETVTLGDALISESDLETFSSYMDLALSNAGWTITAGGEDGRLSFGLPQLLPTKVSGAIQEFAFRLAVPLRKATTASPAEYAIRLTGFALDDAVWNLFDPSKALPRDAANLEIDLASRVKSNIEWLDFLAVPDAIAALGGALPFEPEDLSINAFLLEAAGAKLSVTGALTFDIEDLETYAGFPRPDGQVEIDLKGMNQLLDILTSSGLLQESEATGARMVLATIATPKGEDHLESKIEMTSEGHVLANGNRLK